MPDSFFSEEHELFRKNFRDYVQREIAPHTDAWEKAEQFPREIFAKMAKQGFLGVSFPEEVGGAGGDFWHTVVWVEELARGTNSAGFNMGLMVQTEISTPIVNLLGTPEQKKEFLIPAIKGEKVAALGITEPNCGSDVANIRTTARRDGDDFVINGSKTFITNGTQADWITLAVRTGPEGHGGLSLVLFPTATKGFRVARKLKKLDNHASDTGELSFEDCRIPVKNLLGVENKGFYYIMQNFQGERLVAAIAAVAACEQAIKEAIAYGNDRTAFGRPIVKYQVWRHEMVQLLSEVEAAKWLTYRACDLYNRGVDAVTEITMAKLIAGELGNKVMDRCLQLHGGYGYMEEFPISRRWRDMRLITIGAGTSEIMREILSKRLGLG